jgi:3-oxoacyl-[acyl-carrier-protein] synthase-1
MPAAVKVMDVNRDDPIVVIGQGMVSALGLDAATSCAAARAGLRRAQGLEMRVASIDGRALEPAVGHQVPIITHGFEGAPRLAQLAAAALHDLTSRLPFPIGAGAGLYLSMPSYGRYWTGAELIPDPIAKRFFLEEVEEVRPSLDDRDWTDKVLSLAMRQAGLTTEIPLRFVTYAGHSGFAEALSAAVDDLRRSYVELALVGGIDSLVDERALNWLRLTGRLKCGANPAGLEPGEGAAFLAVKRGRSAGGPEGPMPGRIDRIAIAEEDGCRLLGQQPTGRALAGCIRAMAESPDGLWLVTDHNGEAARAMEFGTAISRMSSPNRHWLPPLLTSVAFGDSGAASGALGACLAQSAFLRKYAPAGTAVVASMDDGTQRSAFSITRREGY